MTTSIYQGWVLSLENNLPYSSRPCNQCILSLNPPYSNSTCFPLAHSWDKKNLAQFLLTCHYQILCCYCLCLLQIITKCFLWFPYASQAKKTQNGEGTSNVTQDLGSSFPTDQNASTKKSYTFSHHFNQPYTLRFFNS